MATCTITITKTENTNTYSNSWDIEPIFTQQELDETEKVVFGAFWSFEKEIDLLRKFGHEVIVIPTPQ